MFSKSNLALVSLPEEISHRGRGGHGGFSDWLFYRPRAGEAHLTSALRALSSHDVLTDPSPVPP